MFQFLRMGAGAIALAGLLLPAPLVQAAAGKEAEPLRFSHPGGVQSGPFELVITPGAARAGRTIWCTTNGAVPGPGRGFEYRGPIPIRHTVVVRAVVAGSGAGAPDGAGPEPGGVVLTRTFLFLDDVVRQTGAGFPATWGTNLGRPVPADYAMDPEITGHAAYQDAMVPALRSLPSLSLVFEEKDLFDPVRGIYANPKETGADWERPVSVEWLPAPGGPAGTNAGVGFQVNAGARIQGGWNRRPEESPKHAFRVVFRKKYGPGRLRFPLFGEGVAGAREFDELILRSGCNNTWLHWNGSERRRGEYLRDQWMRESLAAMGHPSARGLFVHLYLNGLYWGIYNLAERPGAAFVAGHEGGKPEHFDVRNADKPIEGDGEAWNALLALVNHGVAGPAEFAAVGERVDVPQLIDFILLNLYGANGDWDRASNWYAARRRTPPGPFRFYAWDGERTLEDVDASTLAFDDDQSPPRLFQKLRENAEFRALFAARARKHLTGDGALTPAAAAARYRRWAEILEPAVVAESARWGDYRRDAHRYKVGPYELYTRDDHWRPEVKRLLTDYFPRRTEVFIRQLRAAGLYGTE